MHMHTIIIGAGISGLMSALELVEHGHSVHIIDQQNAGKAASWAGGGILSPMYPWRYDPAVNRLAQHAKPLYSAWNEKLKYRSQIDFQIHETGMLIFDEDDFDAGLNYAKNFNEPLQHAEYLQHEQLEQINPHIHPKFKQAIYFPQLANVRNPRLLQSLITYLKQQPHVKFSEHDPIVQLEIQQDQVIAVTNARGEKIYADQFILATGAWSQHWTDQLGVNIPIEPIHGQMVLLKTPENWLPTMCMNKVMYLIPRMDGHVVCGSSMRQVGFDLSLNAQVQHNILEACFEMIPELEAFPIVHQWAGLRPSSPNGVPYIGKIPDLNNLWVNFGHFRNGLCMGAASAQLLRQLMLNQPTIEDPSAYSPQRLYSHESHFV